MEAEKYQDVMIWVTQPSVSTVRC